MTREFTCIVCPNGCGITAEHEGGRVLKIDGTLCPKGETYVRQELTDPRRSIASSVPVDGGELPLVSVRLDKPAPKCEIFNIMRAINSVRVKAPVKIGQVVIQNVCGLGCDVVITKNVDRQRA